MILASTVVLASNKEIYLAPAMNVQNVGASIYKTKFKKTNKLWL